MDPERVPPVVKQIELVGGPFDGVRLTSCNEAPFITHFFSGRMLRGSISQSMEHIYAKRYVHYKFDKKVGVFAYYQHDFTERSS